MPNEVSEKLLIYLIVDFITKLSFVVERNAILVVCDMLFQMTYFVTTAEEIKAEWLIWLFKENMWKLDNLSKSVILDWQPQFVVDLTRESNKMLGIVSTTFYSQIDKQTERMN